MNQRPAAPPSIEYDPRLVEEAVLLALAGHLEEPDFRAERDAVYEVSDAAARERRFLALHARWFERLELHEPLRAALNDQPLVMERVARCMCRLARRKKDEGAELFVDALRRDRPPVLGLALLPDTLLDESVAAFLRHELQHVADMLDPAFAYEPSLPRLEGGPARDRLLADRYRVLWDTYIDGRLVRGGRISPCARQRRLREFETAFAGFTDDLTGTFDRFFDPPRPLTHADLARFAARPFEREAGGRCALCRCPTYSFEPRPLDREVADLIARQFPGWQAAQPVCRQCADLYRARAAAAVSPERRTGAVTQGFPK